MNQYYHVEWHDGSRWCLLSTHESKPAAHVAITHDQRGDPGGRYRLTPAGLFAEA